MSTIDNILKATTDLNHTVSTECDRIEAKLQELEVLKRKIEIWELSAKFPYYRLGRNQLGSVSNGLLNYFYAITADCDVHFEVHRTVKSDIPWAERDEDEQALLTAMGKSGARYTLPQFNVVRVTWKRKPGISLGRLFVQQIIYHSWITSGCYAKLISGAISDKNGGYFQGITHEWGLCGYSVMLNSTSYTNPHPYAASDTGEVLFCLLGSIAGYLPIDRNNPRWGYFPYMQTIQD